jgi:glycerol kinase
MAYLLALDQGTSSSRSIVFDSAGAIVAMAQRELPQVYPQPGWVEHDALEIWDAQLATAREALAKAGIGAKDVAAIGITNQRETAVVWNRQTGPSTMPSSGRTAAASRCARSCGSRATPRSSSSAPGC